MAQGDADFDQAVDWLLSQGEIDHRLHDIFDAIAEGSITVEEADDLDIEEIRARRAANPNSRVYEGA